MLSNMERIISSRKCIYIAKNLGFFSILKIGEGVIQCLLSCL